MKKNLTLYLCFVLYLLFPLSTFSASKIHPEDFIKRSNLEIEFKAYCLKMQTSDSTPQIFVIDSTSRQSQGLYFESVRFEMSKKGLKGQTDCRGEREIIQFVGEDHKRSTLFDSSFYPLAYCDSPVRFSQPPIVYEMESLDGGKANTKKRKLAVIEFVSSTLPCPDTDDAKLRRFLIFDMNDLNKPLLDLQGDFIVPEIGNYPYRLHLMNINKVFHSSFIIPSGKQPSGIELRNDKFTLLLKSGGDKLNPRDESDKKKNTERVRLNSIYSKDQKLVYYETADGSGQIEGADPNTFQLLSTEDESAYTKDAKKVFFFGKVILSADAKTFIQMNDRYGKDINHVYHMDSILHGADVASFITPFKNVWYSKDKNHVFSGKKIFKLADPQTFSTGDDRSCGNGCSYRSEDKNFRFSSDDKVVQKIIGTK